MDVECLHPKPSITIHHRRRKARETQKEDINLSVTGEWLTRLSQGTGVLKNVFIRLIRVHLTPAVLTAMTGH
jgi:hypothetical protein